MLRAMCTLLLVMVVMTDGVGMEARAQGLAPPPELVVQGDRTARPLVLTAMDVHVVIRGLLAETSMTLTFHNPNDRVLEGELVFPLPDDATVSGYGLDIDGTLVEGVVVEKQKARVAFEAEVRKGVDPGLVEWVRGNLFRTRVYPILANDSRTIMVRYVTALDSHQGTGVYFLPLNMDRTVEAFHLKAEVVKGQTKPEVTSGLVNFRFAQWEDRFVAETREENYRLDRDLRIALPDMPQALTSIETDGEDGAVFVIHTTPSVPAGASPTKSGSGDDPATAKRIGLFWDASYSRDKADLDQEKAFLQALLGRWQRVEVDLVLFRDQPEAPRRFVITDGQTAALEEALLEAPLDGGTALGRLDFAAGAHDFLLLMSDGHGTLDQDLPKTAPVPLYTVASTSTADHLLLRHLARTSGGTHINLTRQMPADAAAAFGKPRFGFLGADYDPGAVTELFPEGWEAVDGRFEITGRLQVPEAEMVLRFGDRQGAELRIPVTLRRSEASDTGLVPRFWAQKKVQSLALFPDRNADALLALGRRYGLVTPGTSLLVLETLEQHIEHDVEPPASRPEMRAAWRAHQTVIDEEEKSRRDTHLEHLIRLWNQRVAWWEKDFTYRPKDQKEASRRDGGDSERSDGRTSRRQRTSWWQFWRRNESRSQAAERVTRNGDDDFARAAEAPMDGAAAPQPAMAPPPSPSAGPTATLGGAMAPEPQAVAADAMTGAELNGEGEFEEMADDEAPGAMAKSAAPTATGATIAIKPWDPQTPYIATLNAADRRGRAYDSYLDQRAGYGESPAFFLDVANWFANKEKSDLSRRVLTSILELGFDDPPLLRVVAYRLLAEEAFDDAITLFTTVLRLRPEEPQSHRDLALALAQRGESDSGSPEARAQDLTRAMALLYDVVMRQWDRFAEIELIALEELNRLIALRDRLPEAVRRHVTLPDLDRRLQRLLDLDVRVVVTWDADMTDIDLWVTEPTGEKAYYSNNLTRIGGSVSRDFTQGYGPEAYTLRRLVPGDYRIQVDYFGSSQQKLTGAVTVRAVVFTNYGRADEKRQELTVSLGATKEVAEIGTVSLK